MPIAATVADEANLTRHADLIDDLPGAIDSLAPARSFYRRGNPHIVKRGDRGGHARIDLRVVEKEHADGEGNDERADEQPEVQVQIARPLVEGLLDRALAHQAPTWII